MIYTQDAAAAVEETARYSKTTIDAYLIPTSEILERKLRELESIVNVIEWRTRFKPIDMVKQEINAETRKWMEFYKVK